MLEYMYVAKIGCVSNNRLIKRQNEIIITFKKGLLQKKCLNEQKYIHCENMEKQVQSLNKSTELTNLFLLVELLDKIINQIIKSKQLFYTVFKHQAFLKSSECYFSLLKESYRLYKSHFSC